jgi:hypothetical protein
MNTTDMKKGMKEAGIIKASDYQALKNKLSKNKSEKRLTQTEQERRTEPMKANGRAMK